MTGESNGPEVMIHKTVFPIPPVGIAGALYYDGKNVSDLIKSVSRLCCNNGVAIESENMFEHLAKYYKGWVSNRVVSSKTYRNKDWKDLPR